MAELRNMVEVQPFASNIGEYIWLRGLADDSHRGVSPSTAEAKRAFVFVGQWVLRWEAFSIRFVSGRYRTWQEELAPPAPPTKDATAAVVSVVVEPSPWVPEGQEPTFAVAFQVAAAPNDVAAWTGRMASVIYLHWPSLVGDSGRRMLPSIDRTGLIHARGLTREEILELPGFVEGVLSEVASTEAASALDSRDLEEADEQIRLKYSRALSNLEYEGSSAVAQISVSRQGRPDDAQNVTVRVELALPARLQPLFRSQLDQLVKDTAYAASVQVAESPAFTSGCSPADARHLIDQALVQTIALSTDAQSKWKSRVEEGKELEETLSRRFGAS